MIINCTYVQVQVMKRYYRVLLCSRLLSTLPTYTYCSISYVLQVVVQYNLRDRTTVCSVRRLMRARKKLRGFPSCQLCFCSSDNTSMFSVVCTNCGHDDQVNIHAKNAPARA